MIRTKLSLMVASLVFVACSARLASASSVKPMSLPDSWTKYNSEDGNFSVELPRSPSKSTQAIPTPNGNIDLYLTLVGNDTSALLVGYFDIAPELLAGQDVEKMFDGARDGVVNNTQGKVLRERKITLEGHRGREVTFRGDTENVKFNATLRLYIVNNRVYEVLALNQQGEPNQGAQRFLDSFSLVAQDTGSDELDIEEVAKLLQEAAADDAS